jgi:hypothetical protein
MGDELPTVATCRGCRRKLDGHPYHTGKPAYIPETGERAKVNHYGGWVCSESCDRRASLALEQTMPGHGYSQTRIGSYAQRSLERNWP